MALTNTKSLRLLSCETKLKYMCEKMDEIADLVRYMANRTADNAKEGTEGCLDTKSE